jgi:hypothetical protein
MNIEKISICCCLITIVQIKTRAHK